MKRFLTLSPLALCLLWLGTLSSLVACTANISTTNTNQEYKVKDVVYNVYYQYNFETKHYEVVIADKKYNVHPRNYYYIELEEWHYTEKQELIYNEFYSNSLELFVYHRQ